MDCNLNKIVGLFVVAFVSLVAAIILANAWPTALPLFIASTLVGLVGFVVVPALRRYLVAYAECRGASDKCSMNHIIDQLGQAAGFISAISFLLAALLQIIALAFIATEVLILFGLSLEGVVSGLVITGISFCGIAILILAGVLTNLYSYKNCMDRTS